MQWAADDHAHVDEPGPQQKVEGAGTITSTVIGGAVPTPARRKSLSPLRTSWKSSSSFPRQEIPGVPTSGTHHQDSPAPALGKGKAKGFGKGRKTGVRQLDVANADKGYATVGGVADVACAGGSAPPSAY